MRLLVFVVAFAAACKDEGDPSPPPRGASGRAMIARAPVDALIPQIAGAKILRRASGEGDATITWCLDQADATERVKTALAAAGWLDIRTRGQGDQLGIAAKQGDARFSARAIQRDPRCAGTLVRATVMRLGGTITAPR